MLFFNSFLSAQEFSVKGIVINEENEPLDFAQIVLTPTENETYTNEQGAFVLKNIQTEVIGFRFIFWKKKSTLKN